MAEQSSITVVTVEGLNAAPTQSVPEQEVFPLALTVVDTEAVGPYQDYLMERGQFDLAFIIKHLDDIIGRALVEHLSIISETLYTASDGRSTPRAKGVRLTFVYKGRLVNEVEFPV